MLCYKICKPTPTDFPGMCFASTQCKVYPPDETWSLEPFCGQSTCRAMKNPDAKIKLLEVVLAEEVVDCGPLIDLEKSTGCTLVKDDAEETAEPKVFPECCPKYDCGEDAKIVYVGAGPAGKEGGVEAAVATAAEVQREIQKRTSELEKELTAAGIVSQDE